MLIIGCVDAITEFELNFFVFYFLPISIAAWFIGKNMAMAWAFLATILWYGATLYEGHFYSTHFYAVWNTAIHFLSFIIIAQAIFRIRSTLDLTKSTAEKLNRALAEVKMLGSFLPICMQCKKIRNESGTWDRLEKYIMEHSNSQFSHGYCPECRKKLMEEAGII